MLPPNAKPLSFLVNTSSWDVIHLRVLRVLCFNDLPLNRIYPPQYAIPEGSELALRVQKLFGLSREEVRSASFSATDMTNPFYSELSILIRTNQKTPSPPTKTDAPHSSAIAAQVRSVGGAANTILGSSFPESSIGRLSVVLVQVILALLSMS